MSKKFLLIASYADSLINFRGQLIDALLSSGIEVYVAAPELSETSAVRKILESKGVQVHDLDLNRTGLNPVKDVKSLIVLCKLIYHIKPDSVLGYTIKPVIYGSLAAFIARVPNRFALVTGLGYAFTGEAQGKRKILRNLIQRLYKAGLACTHKVFFQNPDDEALFRQLGLLSSEATTCIVNGSGVNVSDYDVVPTSEKAHFLLIARLLGDKGVREYAAAAQLVRQSYPQAQFSLVGWIDDNPDAIKQSELDLWVNEGAINFLGKLSDVKPAIADCNIYVLPSYREGTPRTVLEAMSMGRPVITTDAPGCRETVIDGENGFLVPVKAVDELAESLERFILQPELIKQMGVRSRQISEEKYDVHKVNEVMLSEMGIK